MGFWWSSSVKPQNFQEYNKMHSSIHREELRKKILECFEKQTFLQHILDPDGWKAFHEFMESEYCGENTRFWQAVQELRLMQDNAKIEAAVKKIYDQHFGDTAAEPLNLSYSVVTAIITSINEKNFTRFTFDLAQKRVVSLMQGSQWHRYPNTTFFNLWVEAKLSNPDSIIITPDPSTNENPKFEENEVKERLSSLLRSKPLKDFLSDPNGYRCFETYLQNSKLGFEYLEYLIFWVDVESFKDHPTLNSASKIYSKHFGNPDNKDECRAMIQIPVMMLVALQEAIASGSVKKELFNDIQSRLSNKLKRDAFDFKFWMSPLYAEYLNSLISIEINFLRDINENGSKESRCIFNIGKPSSEKGLDSDGFQTVLSNILEKYYCVKWKRKNRYQKWCAAYMQQYGGTTPGYISFPEFLTFYKDFVLNPNVPCQHVRLKIKSQVLNSDITDTSPS